MRPFIDPNRGGDLEGDEKCRYKSTNRYFEMEYPANGKYLVVYFIQIDDYTVAIAACWEQYFDGIEQWMADDYSVQTFTETWPLCAKLLLNGINNQYSQGALIRSADHDTTDLKWFLCTFVGNLNVKELFCERTREAERLVVDLSVQLLNEVTTKQPNQFAHYGRSFWGEFVKGFGKGVAVGLLGALLGGGAYYGSNYSDNA